MTRAAIYTRQSKELDEGIERQMERTRDLARARDWEVVAEFSDNDVSASKSRGKSSDWSRLLDGAKAKHFTHVIAVDLDRLVRSQSDLLTLIELGLAVVTVDGEMDLSTADGEFRASLGAGLARFEVRRKGERTRRANAYRASQGRPIPGRRRLGYETDGVTLRTPEATVVRRIFEHIADGGSVYGIAKALIDEGVSPAPGRSWTPRRIRDIGNNRHYAGYAQHLKEWRKSDLIEPVVSEELSERVRAILGDPTRTMTPGPARRHLLSGLAVCGACGAAVKHVASSYRCSASHSHPQILARFIEPQVRDAVVWAIATGGPDLIAQAAPSSALTDLLDRWERNEKAQSKTLEERREGLLTERAARSELVALAQERDQLTEALEQARAEQSAAGALLTVARDLLGGRLPASAGLLKEGAPVRAGVAEKFDELDVHRQREVVRALLTVQVDPGRGPERVRIQHLLATHLDPANVDPENLDYS